MKNIIAVIALSTFANIAAADGFAPWESRMVAADNSADAPRQVENSGFSPWETHTEVRDTLDSDTLFSVMPVNGFRPWS